MIAFGACRCSPTQKPVPLVEWIIKSYSNEGDCVFDPTCGSGTTGVAALNTGRDFIGVESDDTYFALAKDRLEKLHTQEIKGTA